VKPLIESVDICILWGSKGGSGGKEGEGEEEGRREGGRGVLSFLQLVCQTKGEAIVYRLFKFRHCSTLPRTATHCDTL